MRRNIKNNLTVLEVAKFGKNLMRSNSKIKRIYKTKKFYESEHLSLDSSKSKQFLNWKTYLKPKEALKLSFDCVFYYIIKIKISKK